MSNFWGAYQFSCRRFIFLFSSEFFGGLSDLGELGIILKEILSDDRDKFKVLLAVNIQHRGIFHRDRVCAGVEKGLDLLRFQRFRRVRVKGCVHVIPKDTPPDYLSGKINCRVIFMPQKTCIKFFPSQNVSDIIKYVIMIFLPSSGGLQSALTQKV